MTGKRNAEHNTFGKVGTFTDLFVFKLDKVIAGTEVFSLIMV